MNTPKTKAKSRAKQKSRTNTPQTYPLSQVPEGFFTEMGWPFARRSGGLSCPEEALTLSPFWAGLSLFQRVVSSLPLITYQKTARGRERFRSHSAYKILSERPNPGMSAAEYWEFVLKELFLRGNSLTAVSWATNHKLLAMYPIPWQQVVKVERLPDWSKRYHVETAAGKDIYEADEVIHFMGPMSHNGIVGISFLDYASQSLQLHRQVLDSATAYYQNAERPSVYVTYPGVPDKAALEANRKAFADNYAGTGNTGKTAAFTNGGEVKPWPVTTAEEAKLIEGLGAGVADIARWFGLSPLLLADLTRGTYSNLGADNLAFYTKSIAPLLNKLSLEINYKMFGADHDVYAEFLVQKLLETNPELQSQIYVNGVTAGYYLPSEIREWQNLPYVDGLDERVTSPQPQQPQHAQPQVPEVPQEEDAPDDSDTPTQQ